MPFDIKTIEGTEMVNINDLVQGNHPVTLNQIKDFTNLESITYSALSTKISNSTLSVGQSYLISDYQTVHTIPGTSDTNTGPTEPLIVTAIAVNELSPIAYSQLYPNDIIYYHPGTDAINFPGSTKGYISRRIDTIQNNDIGTDWRHVKYRRYAINEDTWNAGTTYAKNAVVKSTSNTNLYVSMRDSNLNNIVTNTSWWRVFEWTNGSYAGVTGTTWTIGGMVVSTDANDYQDKLFVTYDGTIFDNIIQSYNLFNSVASSSFNNNYIKNSFINNSIGTNFINNNINNSFTGNSIANYFRYNIVGINFIGNSIGGASTANANQYNIIGNQFSNNSIGQKFQNNIIGNSFVSNILSTNNIGNNIGYYFNNNIIYGSGFSYNTIGNYFTYNTINFGCIYNIFGNDFNHNTLEDTFQYNTIQNTVTYNTFEKEFLYNFIENLKLSWKYNAKSLLDSNEAESAGSYIDLLTGKPGKASIIVGNALAYADFIFDTDGVVTLLTHSANVFTTLQTGTNHVVIKDNGSGVRIVNELGSSQQFTITINYSM